GGDGAPGLCADLSVGPLALASAGSYAIAVDVVLRIPGNDVTQVDLRAGLAAPAADEPVGQGVGARRSELEAAVDRSAAALAEPLRTLGGRASVAAVTARVLCRYGSALPVAQSVSRRASANEDGNAR